MTLQMKGGTRERLSYRALDVEQIGSVYETVMGFTIESAMGRSLAIKAGKHNRTPVFVDLEKLAAAKGKERIKFLKEEADRAQLSANLSKALEAAKSAADLAVALDPIVDERGSPKKHEVSAGTPLLQPTDERRRTGSHYTPRSLTEPIVRYALEPALERLGPNATPEQILDLKICDPAMGSGAFLVEACRAIAARLVGAWNMHKDKKPTIPADEDEELHARRLVAQRCLYGVDKNPLATDLAKLSLWLATLARDHEFSFLDHALKSGDSLVGLTQAQIVAAHWDTTKPGLPLFRQLVKERLTEVVKGRAEIQAAPDYTARAIQEQRHRSLEARLKDIRLMGDAIIAAFFAEEKPKARETRRAEVESWLGGSPVAWDKLADRAATLKQSAHPLAPFHWEIEFPEVFARDNGGFDAIVGNPPFLGGARISSTYGQTYFGYLTNEYTPAGHQCDLVGYFFRRTFDILRTSGCLGLIATNTISQGDTRQGSLSYILHNGGVVYDAVRRYPWPGEAAVIVSRLNIVKGEVPRAIKLNGKTVKRISAYFVPGTMDDAPIKLSDTPYYSKGSQVYGQGFLFDDADPKSSPIEVMKSVLSVCPKCAERIFPYIGGEELNSQPEPNPKRYAIYFSDIAEEKQLGEWPALESIIRERVKPVRDALGHNANNIPLKRRWWAYQAHRPELYAAAKRRSRMLACSQVTTHLSFIFLPPTWIYSQKLCVFRHRRLLSFRNHAESVSRLLVMVSLFHYEG